MATAPFAEVEALVNQGVFGHLSDAVVSIGGGEPFAAIFDNDYAQGGVGVLGMAAAGPVLTAPAQHVPHEPVGLPVVVGGQGYTIAAARPDGAGVILLVLELP